MIRHNQRITPTLELLYRKYNLPVERLAVSTNSLTEFTADLNRIEGTAFSSTETLGELWNARKNRKLPKLRH